MRRCTACIQKAVREAWCCLLSGGMQDGHLVLVNPTPCRSELIATRVEQVLSLMAHHEVGTLYSPQMQSRKDS